MSWMDSLDHVISHQLESLAPETDQTARFPRPVIDSLAKAGLLGLVSSKEVGGLGLGLAEASQVVAKLAQTCPSTAMIVCMHYCAVAVLERFGERLRSFHPDRVRAVATNTFRVARNVADFLPRAVAGLGTEPEV